MSAVDGYRPARQGCRRSSGLSLVELLISTVIVSMIAVAATSLLSVCLQTHAYGVARSDVYREGLFALERMTGGLRRCNYLFIPNAHAGTRDLLAFSANVNTDSDFYFGDPLFPRLNADPRHDMTYDGRPGVRGLDDDGDGSVDEGGSFNDEDDDEDSLEDEDPLDGVDNDGDGNVDEDLGGDATGDGAAGIRGMDDDGDGQVDEGSVYDDDEDGVLGETGFIPVVYSWDQGAKTLEESVAAAAANQLASHVTHFEAHYVQPDRVLVTLTLTGDDGESLTFSEYAYLRNALQRTGRRVR